MPNTLESVPPDPGRPALRLRRRQRMQVAEGVATAASVVIPRVALPVLTAVARMVDGVMTPHAREAKRSGEPRDDVLMSLPQIAETSRAGRTLVAAHSIAGSN